MYNQALSILKELNQLGYQSYIVGGYPRDLYLNIETDDIDICTNATPDIIKSLFHVIKDNSQFGSVVIEKNNFEYEITTFRIDEYQNSRYPKITYTDNIVKDLQRRDFTINTLCIDQFGHFQDFLNIKEDLDNKLIKSLNDPYQKLKEDPLRILRAIRFCGTINGTLDNSLENSMIDLKDKVESLSLNQIQKEVKRMNQKSIDMIYQLHIDVYLKGVLPCKTKL
jgi:tRNA nucleotidyltransferase (CCA-adding enzyme)